jgi:hypothetical protein
VTDNSVVNAILAGSTNLEIREAELVGTWFESNWTADAAGPGGGEGPFQLSPGGPAHTLAQADNPTAALAIMAPAYAAGVASVPQSLWASNPELAAEEAAVAAERPAQSYLSSYGQGALDAAWAKVQGALSGQASTGGVVTTSITGDIGGAIGDATGLSAAGAAISNLGTTVKNVAVIAPVILAGGALIVFGIMRAAKTTGGNL